MAIEVAHKSSAAIGTVTISQSLFTKDTVLALVLKLASSKQLCIKTAKSGGDVSLSLANDAVVLTQRNTIIRSLIGMGLHNALDQAPYYLAGGYAVSAASCAQSAMAMGALTMWMSVADTMRTTTTATTMTPDFLQGLEAHLSHNAYLLSSPLVTVADLDLCVAMILQDASTDSTSILDAATYPNIARWMRQTHAVLVEYATKVGLTSIPVLPQRIQRQQAAQPLVFFYGTEENIRDALASMTARAAPKTGAATVAKKSAAEPTAGADKTKQLPVSKPDKKKKEKQEQAPKKKEEEAANADFNISALDVRVGKIVKAWHHEGSDKLFCEEIDVGNGEIRQIGSGLRAFYQTQDLEGRMVLVLCNLKKRPLAGFPSHGMVLCASNDDHTAVEFIDPPAGSVIGERVVFDGMAGDPEPENKMAKKKSFEKLAPDLQTNEKGEVVWKGAIAKTSAGIAKATNGMPNAHVS